MYPWDAFASSPLGEKGVETVPGVDAAIAGRLADLGYGKAYILAGQLLTMRKNKVVQRLSIITYLLFALFHPSSSGKSYKCYVKL